MAKLIAVQQPQTTFHKDEGGKTNNLMFRVYLQGEIDVTCGGAKGEVPLDVVAVFEDGTVVPRQDEVISITGCTEKPNGSPCLCLVSRLGGVTYRLKQVSKRLDDRAVCVRITLKGCPEVEHVTSNGTMVYSKRKNRTQREAQQAAEREEMERKEAEATRKLVEGLNAEERVTKVLKLDSHSGASTLAYDSTDECSTHSNNGSESLLKRIASLEKTVEDQQKAINDLRQIITGSSATKDTFTLLSKPNRAPRSTSQVTWNIPEFVTLPPVLKRDVSTESFPEFPPISVSNEN